MSDKNTESPSKKSEDSAMGFLGKLVNPSLSELGLLLGDRVRLFRYKNQVKILEKAKEFAEKNEIKVQEIPVKILVPFLENSSLEEDEAIQDKWAAMLVNMADSESNLQNQIFPYILGQISLSEFEGLKQLSEDEQRFLGLKISQMHLWEENGHEENTTEELIGLEQEIIEVEQEGFFVEVGEDFEWANLIRLGLIKQVLPPIEISPIRMRSSVRRQNINALYGMERVGFRITELGEKFIYLCDYRKD